MNFKDHLESLKELNESDAAIKAAKEAKENQEKNKAKIISKKMKQDEHTEYGGAHAGNGSVVVEASNDNKYSADGAYSLMIKYNLAFLTGSRQGEDGVEILSYDGAEKELGKKTRPILKSKLTELAKLISKKFEDLETDISKEMAKAGIKFVPLEK